MSVLGTDDPESLLDVVGPDIRLNNNALQFRAGNRHQPRAAPYVYVWWRNPRWATTPALYGIYSDGRAWHDQRRRAWRAILRVVGQRQMTDGWGINTETSTDGQLHIDGNIAFQKSTDVIIGFQDDYKGNAGHLTLQARNAEFDGGCHRGANLNLFAGHRKLSRWGV